MALAKTSDPAIQALIQQALAEIRQINPRFGTQAPPHSKEQLAQLLEDEATLEQLWASPEGQRAQQLGYLASDAVSEDRGE